MGAITPVAAYKPSKCTTQTGSDYKNTLDGNSVAAQRIVTRFAPHAASPANMTLAIDPGSLFDGQNLNEIVAQATSAFLAPVNYPRIDRVVIDMVSGQCAIVGGTENTTPAPPAIPNGKYPVAQVNLTVGMAAITNSAITDERNFSTGANAAFGAQASIGSAATCDLGTVLSRNVFITGTTNITSFGASANTQSPIYLIEFGGAVTLKNGPTLLLPGGKDILTGNNDTGMAEYLGSGNWRLRDFTRAAGSFGSAAALDVGTAAGNVVQLDQNDKLPAVDGSQLLNLPSAGAFVPLATLDASNSASLLFSNIDSTYDEYEFHFEDILGSGNFFFRLSNDNGQTVIGASNSYFCSYLGTAANYGGSLSYGLIFTNGVYSASGTARLINPGGSSKAKRMLVNAAAGGTSNFNTTTGSVLQPSTAAVNAVQFAFVGGNIVSGRITVFGIKHAAGESALT